MGEFSNGFSLFVIVLNDFFDELSNNYVDMSKIQSINNGFDEKCSEFHAKIIVSKLMPKYSDHDVQKSFLNCVMRMIQKFWTKCIFFQRFFS